MRYDVEALLHRCPELEVVCLSDGARERCNILDEDYPQACARYIDFYHVVEKLAAAIKAYANYRPLRRVADGIIADWRLRLFEPGRRHRGMRGAMVEPSRSSAPR